MKVAPDTADRSPLVPLLALIVAGAVVRVVGLDDYFLSPDESCIMAIARQPTLAAVYAAAHWQAHPPFHFFLMHFWPAPGNSFMWMRAASLLPGLLLIPACFALGKKAVGPAGAWAMAFLAAFGNGPLILSQVVRPYALEGLLLVAGLWFWFDFLERPRGKSAALYGGCLAAALLFNYLAAPFIAGAGLAGAAALIGRRRPFRELLVFCAAHLPAAAAAAVFYFIHLRQIPGLRQSWMEEYLVNEFGSGSWGLLDRLASLGFYFSVRQVAYPFLALLALGLGAMAWKNRPALALAGAQVLVAVAMNLAGLYPLYGNRHSFWLFPAAALAFAAAVELLAGFFRGRAERLPGPVRRRAGLGLVAAAVLITVAYARAGYLRTLPHNQLTEFPFTRHAIEGLMTRIERETRPGDLIIANRQTADLFRFAPGPVDDRQVSPHLFRLRVGRREYIYDPRIQMYETGDQLRGVLAEALAARRPGNDEMILVNVGFCDERQFFVASRALGVGAAMPEGPILMRLPEAAARKAMP